MIIFLMVFPFLCEIVSGDVLTLKKLTDGGENVLCILTQKDINSSVYLFPFSEKKLIPQKSIIPGDYSDWSLVESAEFPFEPITDFRWSELPNFDFNEKPTNILNIPLSVCVSTDKFEFLGIARPLSTGEWFEVRYVVQGREIVSGPCSWVHFTVWTEQHSLILTSTNFTDKQTISSNPIGWFRTRQFPNVPVRKHLYNILWSDSISEIPTILKVNSLKSTTICIGFFVSINEGCELHVVLVVAGISNQKIIKGFNRNQELKKWRYVEITSNFSGGGTLKIYRTSSSGFDNFWAIDRFHYCSHNAAVFTTTVDSNDEPTRCEILQHSGRKSSKTWLTQSTPAGCLGNNCSVKCEDVLDKNYKYCQGHKVCDNNEDNCLCAWGYKGDSCGEQCSLRTWGLNCANECDKNCIQCNIYNGSCEKFGKTSIPSTSASPFSHESTVTSKTSNPSTSGSLLPTSLESIMTSTSIKSFNGKSTTESKLEVTPRDLEPNKTQLMTTDLNSPTISISSSSISSTSFRNVLISTPPKSSDDKSTTDAGKTPKDQPLPYLKGSLFYFVYISIALAVVTICGVGLYFLNLIFSGKRTSNAPYLDNTEVQAAELSNYIKRSLDKDLSRQFNALVNDTSKPCSIALAQKNARKNYDTNNIPYDQYRVVLKPMRDVGLSDYINASYIDGWGRPRAYIVTQGPKSSTAGDFWRMVWQHDVKIIIMATNFRENMQVSLFTTALSIKRHLRGNVSSTSQLIWMLAYHLGSLASNCSHKVVTHYQLQWKADTGKPLYPNDLLPIVKIMNTNYQHEEDWNPIVVHCSLGVQRSAILVLCDMAFQMAKTEGYLDIYDLAKMLREQRPNMITSVKDFILAHLVISECLMDEKNVFDLAKYSHDGLMVDQMEHLDICTRHDHIVHNTPYSSVQGYGSRVSYICGKQPLNDDVSAFWLLVLQQRIKTIIFLNKNNARLWPCRIPLSERRICTVTHSVSIHDKNNDSYFMNHEISLVERDLRTTTIYKADILFLELLDWKFEMSKDSSIEKFIKFVEEVRNLQSNPKKILICCSDGKTGCGLFMVTSYIIEKYLKEIKYDICNAVRNVRRMDNGFISKASELRFLYRMINIYSEKFDPYNNIDNDLV